MARPVSYTHLYSYMDYKGAADRMAAIAKVFPVFFFLVAALVCLTTMTRMVDEQRSQIGTMKALGYTTGQIAFKYVFYAAFASLTGSLVGLAVGLFAFPAIIYTAWLMKMCIRDRVQQAVAMLIRLAIRAPFLVLGSLTMAMMIDRTMALIFLAAIVVIALVLSVLMRCV